MQRVRQLAPTALLLLTAACAGGNQPATAVPEPSDGPVATSAPAVSPAPPELVPVAGERVPGAHWVDSSGLLTHAPAEVGPPDTVLPAVHAVGDWLDAHLDDLQRGGPGRLADVAPSGLLAAADPADVAAVTSALASPAGPVASATYRLDAAYHEATEWVTATVTVTSSAGDTGAATLVFVPAPDGPELILFGPATEAAP